MRLLALRWQGERIGRAKRVVEDQPIDVVVEPRAVVGKARHRAIVGPLGRGVHVVVAAIDRRGELHGIALAERRAPRLRARAAGARERHAQVESRRRAVIETRIRGVALRAKVEAAKVGAVDGGRGRRALHGGLERIAQAKHTR